MKYSYERIKLIYFIICLFLLFVFIFVLFIFNIKIYKYEVFDGVVVKDDLIVIIVSNEDLEMFYSNSFIFINDKKIYFEVKKVNKDVLEREDIFYSEVYLSFKFRNKKENDIISFSILDKKIYSFNIFRILMEDYESIE